MGAVCLPGKPPEPKHTGTSALNLMPKGLAALQIVALREQNAHLQRKVASGEGDEDLLEGEARQRIHGKVSLRQPFFTKEIAC